MEGSIHLLDKGGDILPVRAEEGIGPAAALSGKYGGKAGGLVGDSVGQTADTVTAHGRLNQEHIFFSGVFFGFGFPGNGLQGCHAEFCVGQVLFQPFHGLEGVRGLDGETLSNGLGLVKTEGEIAEGPLTAQDLQSYALAELLTGEDLHKAHLSCTKNVGAAAGAAVCSREGHDAHLSGEFFFAAVVQRFQGLAGREGDLTGDISKDNGIGFGFCRQALLPGDFGIVVDGDGVRTHVEAHIVTVVISAEDTGENVLAGMLLHMVETPFPVNDTGYSFTNFHVSLNVVENHALFFMDVGHGKTIQCAVVSALPSSFRVEGGAVQSDEKAFFAFFTA